MINTNTILVPESSLLINEIMCVAHIFPARNHIFLLPYLTRGKNATKSPDRKPLKFNLDEICEDIKSKKITLNISKLESFKEVPNEFLYSKDNVALQSTLERNRRYKIVKKLLSFEDELYYPTFGKSPVAMVAKELSITRTNAQRYLNLFYRGGCHINSLIPSRGRHSSSQNENSKKVGRHRDSLSLGYEGKNVNSIDKKHILSTLKKYYLTPKGLPLKVCHQKLLDKYYCEKRGSIAPDGTIEKTKHLHPNKSISLNQFMYWAPKVCQLSKAEIQAKRRQKPVHDANFAARAGHSDFQVDGPGAVWQLDSTPIDLELVTPYDRTVALKRATLYVLRDKYSRSITGIHLAYGNASWKEARLALFHAIRNKVDYAKEYDINLSDEDWVEHGVPKRLLVDNEEFQNNISASVGRDLNLTVDFSRSYRGDDKGLAESTFHMIHSMIRNQKIPGYKFKKLIGRDQQISLKSACLTAFEMQQIFIFYAVYHNNHVWKEALPIHESAMLDGINKSCREVWDWGLKNSNFYLTYLPERQLYLSLLEVGVVTVHRTHLHLQKVGANYFCEDISRSGFQNKHTEGARHSQKKLPCRYIRSNVGKILIEFKGKLVTAHLTSEYQSECSKMSVQTFQAWKKFQKNKKTIFEHKALDANSDYSIFVESIVEGAKEIKDSHKRIINKASSTLLNKNLATLQLSKEIDNKETARYMDAVNHEIEFQQNDIDLQPEIEFEPNQYFELLDDDDDDEFIDLVEEI